MSPANSPIVSIRCAEKSNGFKPNEDRIFLTQNAVVILDGASQPEVSEHNGGWIASELGLDLQNHLLRQPEGDLTEILENSIRTVAQKYSLVPDQSPSTTVAIVRWGAQCVDILLLCDSLVIVSDQQGNIHQIRDDRIAAIGKTANRADGFQTDNAERWQHLVDTQRQKRNKPGGYWVAEAVPEAAHHAIKRSFPIRDVAKILVMTDGVSAGVDRYNIPPAWSEAVEIALNDPAKLIEMVHNAEVSDPQGQLWPRSKCHDDKSLVVICFESPV